MILIKKISNIFKEKPLEEEYYELPTIIEKYLKDMNKYISLFMLNKSNISEPNIKQFVWYLENLSKEYNRFVEDYHRYNNDKDYKNHPIIEKMLAYKKKLQKKFIALFNRFYKVACKSDIRMSAILEKIYECLDLKDELWNKNDKESAKGYIAINQNRQV